MSPNTTLRKRLPSSSPQLPPPSPCPPPPEVLGFLTPQVLGLLLLIFLPLFQVLGSLATYSCSKGRVLDTFTNRCRILIPRLHFLISRSPDQHLLIS